MQGLKAQCLIFFDEVVALLESACRDACLFHLNCLFTITNHSSGLERLMHVLSFVVYERFMDARTFIFFCSM